MTLDHGIKHRFSLFVITSAYQSCIRCIYILNSLHNTHPSTLGLTVRKYLEKKAVASADYVFNKENVEEFTPLVSSIKNN